MKYAWGSGRRVAKLDADVVGEELERIRVVTGKLTPPDVVDAARPDDAPLHSAFEWDDTDAGEKYREYQARNLIRAVRVVREDSDGEPVTVPVFVHIDKGAKDRYYQSTEVAIGNVDEWTIAVQGLARKLAGAQKALDEVRQMAEGHGDETLARLTAATIALATALEAIKEIN